MDDLIDHGNQELDGFGEIINNDELDNGHDVLEHNLDEKGRY